MTEYNVEKNVISDLADMYSEMGAYAAFIESVAVINKLQSELEIVYGELHEARLRLESVK